MNSSKQSSDHVYLENQRSVGVTAGNHLRRRRLFFSSSSFSPRDGIPWKETTIKYNNNEIAINSKHRTSTYMDWCYRISVDQRFPTPSRRGWKIDLIWLKRNNYDCVDPLEIDHYLNRRSWWYSIVWPCFWLIESREWVCALLSNTCIEIITTTHLVDMNCLESVCAGIFENGSSINQLDRLWISWLSMIRQTKLSLNFNWWSTNRMWMCWQRTCLNRRELDIVTIIVKNYSILLKVEFCWRGLQKLCLMSMPSNWNMIKTMTE